MPPESILRDSGRLSIRNYCAACAAHFRYEITVWGCITGSEWRSETPQRPLRGVEAQAARALAAAQPLRRPSTGATCRWPRAPGGGAPRPPVDRAPRPDDWAGADRLRAPVRDPFGGDVGKFPACSLSSSAMTSCGTSSARPCGASTSGKTTRGGGRHKLAAAHLDASASRR